MKIPINEFIPLIKECATNNGAYFSPSGTSMLPTIKYGDKVFLIKRAIKKNDIVFYQKSDGTAAMHRAIKIHNGYFTARGDNQFWTEDISNENIIAVVDYYFHNGKRINCNGFLFKLKTFFLPIVRFFRRILNKLGILNIAQS